LVVGSENGEVDGSLLLIYDQTFVIYPQWPKDHAGRRRPLGEDVSIQRRPITIVVAVIISI
jgi:hypothetical protein